MPLAAADGALRAVGESATWVRALMESPLALFRLRGFQVDAGPELVDGGAERYKADPPGLFGGHVPGGSGPRRRLSGVVDLLPQVVGLPAAGWRQCLQDVSARVAQDDEMT